MTNRPAHDRSKELTDLENNRIIKLLEKENAVVRLEYNCLCYYINFIE
jgi:hypothetical protein